METSGLRYRAIAASRGCAEAHTSRLRAAVGGVPACAGPWAAGAIVSGHRLINSAETGMCDAFVIVVVGDPQASSTILF